MCGSPTLPSSLLSSTKDHLIPVLMALVSRQRQNPSGPGRIAPITVGGRNPSSTGRRLHLCRRGSPCALWLAFPQGEPGYISLLLKGSCSAKGRGFWGCVSHPHTPTPWHAENTRHRSFTADNPGLRSSSISCSGIVFILNIKWLVSAAFLPSLASAVCSVYPLTAGLSQRKARSSQT